MFWSFDVLIILTNTFDVLIFDVPTPSEICRTIQMQIWNNFLFSISFSQLYFFKLFYKEEECPEILTFFFFSRLWWTLWLAFQVTSKILMPKASKWRRPFIKTTISKIRIWRRSPTAGNLREQVIQFYYQFCETILMFYILNLVVNVKNARNLYFYFRT